MKKLLFVAALVVMPAVVTGCSCVQPAQQPACPVIETACPPVVTQVVKQPVVQTVPVVQQSCPPVAQPVAVKPFTVYPVAPAPLPVGGQITYAQPIQVSGVNGVVQYYNPYLQTIPAQ